MNTGLFLKKKKKSGFSHALLWLKIMSRNVGSTTNDLPIRGVKKTRADATQHYMQHVRLQSLVDQIHALTKKILHNEDMVTPLRLKKALNIKDEGTKTKTHDKSQAWSRTIKYFSILLFYF
jgi:hypothetical protein